MRAIGRSRVDARHMEQRGREVSREEEGFSEPMRCLCHVSCEVLMGRRRSRNAAMEGGGGDGRRGMSDEGNPISKFDKFADDRRERNDGSSDRRPFKLEPQEEQSRGGSRRDEVWEEKRRKAMER
eukprot:762855-Hanusia_phi.AAC.4